MAHIVIFAKAPQAGQVKTRLIPALGAEGAASLAHRLLKHTLQQALAAKAGEVELCMSPLPNDVAWRNVSIQSEVRQTFQGEGDLGQRLARAVARITAIGPSPDKSVLLVGTDCPALTAPLLERAAHQLQHHDAVLLPAHDGGYVLLGLKSPCPELFQHMPWSTPVVGAQTMHRMTQLKLHVWQGPTLHDIDEPADLQYVQDLLFEPLQQSKVKK